MGIRAALCLVAILVSLIGGASGDVQAMALEDGAAVSRAAADLADVGEVDTDGSTRMCPSGDCRPDAEGGGVCLGFAGSCAAASLVPTADAALRGALSSGRVPSMSDPASSGAVRTVLVPPPR